jgi:hypothetical protein
VNTETTQPPVEEQARDIGWLPKDEFKGNPENWVTAQEYLDRGETVLPYLQSDRRKLQGEVTALRGQIAESKQTERELRESMEELKKTAGAETAAALDDQIKVLRRQLVEARRGGEVETELELEEQLDEAREERKALDKPAAQKPVRPGTITEALEGQNTEIANEIRHFVSENPWYNSDPVLQAAANAMVPELAKDPGYATMTPRQRFALLGQKVRERFGLDGAPPKPRVEGGRPSTNGSGGGGSGGKKGRTYADLPQEAKDQIELQAKRLVGKNRAFETLDQWKDQFVKTFKWEQ